MISQPSNSVIINVNRTVNLNPPLLTASPSNQNISINNKSNSSNPVLRETPTTSISKYYLNDTRKQVRIPSSEVPTYKDLGGNLRYT